MTSHMRVFEANRHIDIIEKNKEKLRKSYVQCLCHRIKNNTVVIEYPNHEIANDILDIPHSYIELPIKVDICNGKLIGYGMLPKFLDFIDREILDDPEEEFPISNITDHNGYAEGKQTFIAYYDNYKISDELGFGIDFHNQTALIFLKRGNMFHYYIPGNTTKSSDLYLSITDKEYKLHPSTDNIPTSIMYKGRLFERYTSFSFSDHIINLNYIAAIY